MKWLRIAAKFPKWVIAGTFLFGSIGGFMLWWQLRRPHGSAQPVAAVVHLPRKLTPFKPADVVLCGNTLVDISTGEIIAREWLQGFGERIPKIVKVLPDERLVLVEGDSGIVLAFDFDGNAKPQLQANGKPVGAGAFSDGGRDVVFAREGNLWRGKGNWLASKVESVQRVTDTGYFREEIFRSPWLWTGDALFVTCLGRVQRINLPDGRIEPQKVNLAEIIHGVSPDHKLVLLPVGLKGLEVIDLTTSEIFPQVTGQHVNNLLWLTPTRAVVQVGQTELGLYDHTTKKLAGIFKSRDPIRLLAGASPDGECFILATAKAAGFFDLKANRLQPFAMPADHLEWLSADTLLVSSPTADTAQRGMWLVHRDGKSEHVLNQPVDVSQSRGTETISILANGLFVSGGELWHCNPLVHEVKQLTHGGQLHPYMRSF
jgi:hypothetical protein